MNSGGTDPIAALGLIFGLAAVIGLIFGGVWLFLRADNTPGKIFGELKMGLGPSVARAMRALDPDSPDLAALRAINAKLFSKGWVAYLSPTEINVLQRILPAQQAELEARLADPYAHGDATIVSRYRDALQIIRRFNSEFPSDSTPP